ncbi:uncharacterized protein LOC111891806 [Lactuca sativa]|uniref:Uncharacterized protein n=1 Tax=Lactuca sativa TaxID=4236 RepID=A0A9R1WZW7_LACSA|nr:uncharacterized protein LOC111891806 [Lactuca sativa]KAJ0192954.1 hypothetical protein LSAT_V11C800442880 [Lactuca sativa]
MRCRLNLRLKFIADLIHLGISPSIEDLYISSSISSCSLTPEKFWRLLLFSPKLNYISTGGFIVAKEDGPKNLKTFQHSKPLICFVKIIGSCQNLFQSRLRKGR